jgi:hypothetical protein
MSIPRDAWWEKWERAEEHRLVLADEIVETFDRDENKVRTMLEPGDQPGEYVFRVTAVQTAPLMRWAIMTGDVVHNYRGSLDHLAWRLALLHNHGSEPTHPNWIVFPIHDQRRKFVASRIRKKFDGFHWSIFDEFQPYQGRRGRPDSWSGDYIPQLALLQLLSNRDKHQHLTPILLPPTGFYFPGGVFPAPTAPGVFPWDPFGVTPSTEPLELGAVALRIRLRDPKSRARVGAESYVVPSVSLPLYGPLIPALERIGIFVRGVLAEFDPLI